MATFLPANKSPVVTGVGLPSCIVCSVASGSFVPVSIAMVIFLSLICSVDSLCCKRWPVNSAPSELRLFEVRYPSMPIAQAYLTELIQNCRRWGRNMIGTDRHTQDGCFTDICLC